MSVDQRPVPARLLRSAARRSYDPEVDIAWDAPMLDDAWAMPPERTSLHGTPLWDALTRSEQQVLVLHEAASVVQMAWWFELLLMRGLLQEADDADPRSVRTQWALTEVADECRHSTMFGRVLSRFGTPLYGPPPALRRAGRHFTSYARGPSLYAAALVVEETQDRWQRAAMDDERLQPLSRMVCRIHVVEEARHVTFARDELERTMPRLGALARERHRFVVAQLACAAMRSLVHPQVYASVGIDPRAGRRAAWANPEYRATIAWTGEKVMPFLTEVGLVAHPHLPTWRASGLLR